MFKFNAFVFLFALFAFAPQSIAHPFPFLLAQANYINLDQAVNKVKHKHAVKVLGAKTIQVDGEAVHVIKVLTKAGRVKKIRVRSAVKPQP